MPLCKTRGKLTFVPNFKPVLVQQCNRAMTKKTERVAASVEPETKEEIENELEYGDTISDWVREAIREKLERDCEGEKGKKTVSAD
jgi:hypothetical protein